jgi:hypothetical protein
VIDYSLTEVSVLRFFYSLNIQIEGLTVTKLDRSHRKFKKPQAATRTLIGQFLANAAVRQ